MPIFKIGLCIVIEYIEYNAYENSGLRSFIGSSNPILLKMNETQFTFGSDGFGFKYLTLTRVNFYSPKFGLISYYVLIILDRF